MNTLVKISLFGIVLGLAGCMNSQTTPVSSSAEKPALASVEKSVNSAIKARSSELAGIDHGACENAEFYAALGSMTSANQVRNYYSSQGFKMSSDGSGGTAIAALSGEPFTGRMAGKAVCFLRAATGRH